MNTSKLLVIILLIISSSCTVTTYESRVTNITKKEVIAQPVIVDLKVDLTKKVTGEGKSKNLDFAKEAALASAMESSGADVVIDPIFVISKTRRTYKVKVNGFYAKYENPRTFMDASKEGSQDGSFEKLLKYWEVNKPIVQPNSPVKRRRRY